MAQYNLTLDSEDVQGLFSTDEGVSRLMEKVANQVLDQQATEQIVAVKYERSESRTAYRSGYRSRFIKTRFGRLELRVPRLRNGQFDTEMLRIDAKTRMRIVSHIPIDYHPSPL